MKRAKRHKVASEFRFPKRYTRVPRNQMQIADKENMNPRHTKVRVNIYLDQDIVQHFKERAAKPNSQPYQTQINAELRRIIDEQPQTSGDDPFVERIAARVAEKLSRQLRGLRELIGVRG